MKKIKQLFCNHRYVFFPYEDIYLSVGDDYHERKSRLYRGECTKCNHQIDFIKRWTLLDQENSN